MECWIPSISASADLTQILIYNIYLVDSEVINVGGPIVLARCFRCIVCVFDGGRSLCTQLLLLLLLRVGDACWTLITVTNSTM